LIVRAFGWQEPHWVHLSVFLKPSGKGKMSKREAADLIKDGHSIFIKDLEGLGYLPEAVDNWIGLMGWSYDDHTEFFKMADLIEKFSLEKLNPSPAAINFTKFDYFNGLHIRSLAPEDLAQRILPFFLARGIPANVETLTRIAPLLRERLVTLDDALDFADFFFSGEVIPVAEELVSKGLSAAQSAEIARLTLKVFESLPGKNLLEAEALMRELVEELGYSAGQVFGLLRVAVTGKKVSPPLFESIEIIGYDATLERIRQAVRMLEALAAAGQA
jgi:glutamyl-tRNA synthetase